MKPLLFAVVLALALPVCAQAQACSNQDSILVPVRPDAGSWSCTAKDGTIWTIAYQDTEGGLLEVTSNGPNGSFTWQQSEYLVPGFRYAACVGDVCWKYHPFIVYLLGGKNVYLSGRFIVAD